MHDFRLVRTVGPEMSIHPMNGLRLTAFIAKLTDRHLFPFQFQCLRTGETVGRL